MADTTPSGHAEPGRPLRRDAERNRLKIMAAASEVFSREGLDATMDQIAEAAGVGIATTYRRFPDKYVLIDALFEQRLERLVQVGQEALACNDAWDGLVHFMHRSLELFAGDRGLVDAVFEPTGQATKSLAGPRQRLAPLAEQLLRRAQDQGRVRADLEPTDIPVLQLMISLILRFAGDVAPHIWERYLTLVLDALRPDRRRPTPLPVPALDADELAGAIARGGAGLGRRAR